MTGDELIPISRQIRRDIGTLVISEGFGSELFSAAGRLAPRRDKELWCALYELERQTRLAVMAKLGGQVEQFASRDRLSRSVGTVSGAGLAALPHSAQMRALIAGTRPFMACFERLAEHFDGTAHEPFFAYVLAHERAIAEAARRTLAHQTEPLAPVEKLLGYAT